MGKTCDATHRQVGILVARRRNVNASSGEHADLFQLEHIRASQASVEMLRDLEPRHNPSDICMNSHRVSLPQPCSGPTHEWVLRSG